LLELSHDLKDSLSIYVNVQNFVPLKFHGITTKIDSPYFYLLDGTIPFVLRGECSDWTARESLVDSVSFTEMEPISKTSFVFRTIDLSRKQNTLGKIARGSQATFNHDLLKKQIDGIFCTDGMLHYCKDLNKLLYLYYYRNQYIVTDTNLNLHSYYATIDTFSVAPIKTTVINYNGSLSHQLTTPPRAVNQRSLVYGKWLFVLSNVEAKNELPDAFKRSSVVDVYDIQIGKYQFSFYLQDEHNKKLKHFLVDDDVLFALYEQEIQSYRLNPKFFKSTIRP